MGCFSFKCQKCGRGIKSSSFSGEQCHLFLLQDGKIIQQMSGEYDSYGRVFIDGTQDPTVKHALRDSQRWQKIKDNDRDAWSDVCDLMFSDDISNGIAAFHKCCYDDVLPTIRSANDPNQGWGDEDEDEEYFSSTEGEGAEYPPPKPIPGYDVYKDLRSHELEQKIWRLKEDIKFQKMLASMDHQNVNALNNRVKTLEDKLIEYNKELEEITDGIKP